MAHSVCGTRRYIRDSVLLSGSRPGVPLSYEDFGNLLPSPRLAGTARLDTVRVAHHSPGGQSHGSTVKIAAWEFGHNASSRCAFRTSHIERRTTHTAFSWFMGTGHTREVTGPADEPSVLAKISCRWSLRASAFWQSTLEIMASRAGHLRSASGCTRATMCLLRRHSAAPPPCGPNRWEQVPFYTRSAAWRPMPMAALRLWG